MPDDLSKSHTLLPAKQIAITCMIVFLVRLAILIPAPGGPFQHPTPIENDELNYWALANALVESHFTSYYVEGDSADQRRLPLIPILAGFVISITGTGGAFTITWTVLQLAMYSLALGIVLWIFRRLGLDASLFAVAALTCFDFVSLWNATRLLTEATFVLCFTICIASLPLAAKEETKVRTAVVAGTFLTLSIFARPIAMFFVLPAAVILWAKSTQKHSKRYIAPGIMICIYLFGIGSWQVRNKVVHDKFFFSEVGKVNFCFYWGAQMDAFRTGESFSEAQARLRREFSETLGARINDAKSRQAFMVNRAVQAFRANPSAPLRFLVPGVFKIFWGRATSRMNVLFDQEGVGLMGHVRNRSPLPYLVLIWGELFILLVSYSFAGFVVLRLIAKARYRIPILIVLTPILYLLALGWGPEATARFRIPMMPWLIALAACAPGLFRRKVPIQATFPF